MQPTLCMRATLCITMRTMLRTTLLDLMCL
jgi:hypothetical protein